jgi:hypothetical protein
VWWNGPSIHIAFRSFLFHLQDEGTRAPNSLLILEEVRMGSDPLGKGGCLLLASGTRAVKSVQIGFCIQIVTLPHVYLRPARQEHKSYKGTHRFGFEVVSPVSLKNTIFWVVTPCRSVEIQRSFVLIYRLLLQRRRLSQTKYQKEIL